jgi:branched-chain amino acid transport system ATP-binding protein
MEPILTLDHIHTYYGESHVLHGVSLTVSKGSVVALLGRNGMGKTTTIHSIIGMTPPRRGTITFKGQDIRGLPSYRIARTGIGLIPQGHRVFSSLSVKENITVAAKPGRGGGGWTLDDVYALFPVLKERRQFRGNLLSGGEQQLLAIGRALTTNPDLLLMDEPSEGLAPLAVQNLITVIKELHEKGFSILLVEQNLPMALAVADHVYILNKGEVVYSAEPAELCKNEDVLTTYLGVAVGDPGRDFGGYS